MKIAYAILLSFFFTVSAHGTHINPWNCRFSLAFAGGNPETEITEAYESVWKDLGSDVHESTLLEMIKNREPFVLPPHPQEKSATLRETLSEFKKMVLEAGIDLEKAKEVTLQSLSKRVKKVSDTEDKQQKKMVEEAFPRTLSWPDHLNSPLFGATDKVLYTTDNSNGVWISQNFKPFEKIQDNTKTGKTFLSFEISPGGKYAFFNKMGDLGVYRAKLLDDQGHPLKSWTPELWYTRKPKDKYDDTQLGRFEFSHDEKYVLGELDDSIYIFDTTQATLGKKTPVFKAPAELRATKFLPGSTDFVVFDTDQIHILDIDGKVKSGPFNYSPDGGTSHESYHFHNGKVFISADSKFAFTNDTKQGLLKINLQNGHVSAAKPELKAKTPGAPYSEKAEFTTGLLDPDGRYFYLVKKEGPKSNPDEVFTYDLQEGKFVHSMTMPHKRVMEMRASPNQRYLITSYLDFEGYTLHDSGEFGKTP